MRRIVLPDQTHRLLELAGVSALAIAQPVLADLAGDPGTFVLRRTTAAEVAAFVALLLLGPPLLAWCVEELVRRLRPRAVPTLHSALLAAGVLLWVAQLLAAAGLGTVAALALAVVAAAAVGAAAHRPTVRSVLTPLSALVPGLAVWFLLLSPVSDVPFGGGGEAPVTQAVPGEHPPIVFIVLDELPTLSLMDRAGAIDADRFPAFARLAGASTWYRNHTAMAPGTAYSVPAILTSTEPEFRKLPVAAHHPVNLFSLLAPTYELHVLEPEWLCAPELECNAPTIDGTGVGGLLRDAWRLIGERVDPPPVVEAAVGNDPGAVVVGDEELVLAAPQAIDTFVAGLGGSEGPRLDYLHVLAPHQPWRFLPDGREHGAEGLRGAFLGGWADDRAGEEGRIRHLLQLAWTDAELGRILDRLDEIDRFDDSLIVVTADHGVAFRGGASLRASNPATLHDIYWAPLLVKLPQQREGAVVDGPVTSLDVLPTVLSGARMPPLDGALGAALDPLPPADRGDDRRIWVGANTELAVDGRFTTIDGAAAFAALLAAADSNPGPEPLDTYRQGPNGDLIGRRVAELRTRPGASRAVLHDGERFDDVDPDAPDPPTWVTVDLPDRPGDTAEVAIVVDGTVAATPIARLEEGGLRAAAIIPVELLADGRTAIEVYVVERDRSGRRVLVGGPVG